MSYDYEQAMIEDIKEYIYNHYEKWEMRDRINSREEWAEELDEALWVEDSVTGNASGSYTFSSYVAEEYLVHNFDLLAEALSEFGDDVNILEKGAEWCDVTIRCYLLYSAIRDALDEIENELENEINE